MVLKINNSNLLQGLNGEIQLVFGVDKSLKDKAQEVAQNTYELLKQNKPVGLTVQPITRRRSLDANAYFHVLCDKIAAKLQLSMDDVKVNLVLNYGTPKYVVSIPNTANISDIWPYGKFIGEDGENTQYMLFKQTHTLDTAEMSRLIKGSIQEAEQLGIETLTPKELAELEKRWEKQQTKKQKTEE